MFENRTFAMLCVFAAAFSLFVCNDSADLRAQGQPRDLELLQFGARNCENCARIQPLINEFLQKDYPIRYVDVDEHRELAARFQIQELPTFVLLVHGREVDRFVGAPDRKVLQPQLIHKFNYGTKLLRNGDAPSAPSEEMNRNRPDLSPGQDRPLQLASTLNPGPTPIEGRSNPEDPQSANTANCRRASVRILVGESGKTYETGTGTIIDTRNGEALILTCAHIFRTTQGRGAVEVHLFQDNMVHRLQGKQVEFIDYDLTDDIAFLRIFPPVPVRAVPLAPRDNLQPGQDLISVGCDSGAPPSVREHRILSLNGPFSNSPQPFYYIQVAGAPVQGRSGGGLFDVHGYLVGVCNTGDPGANDGLFVPLHVIRRHLDRLDYSIIYQSPSLQDRSGFAGNAAAAEPLAPVGDEFSAISQSSFETEPVFSSPGPPYDLEIPPLSLKERATLEEIRRRQGEGAEVIVIINPPHGEKGKKESEIIKLSSVSPQFIDALVGKNQREMSHREKHPTLTDQAAAMMRERISPGHSPLKSREPGFPSAVK